MGQGKIFVKGFIWQSAGRYSGLIIQLIVTIILARYLEPKDFGTIGLLNVFIAISQVLVDSGFSAALIQKKEVSETDYSTIFSFNVGLSIFLYFLLFFVSPLIASFYNISDLTYYSRYLFLVIPINALSLIQGTMLRRELRFKDLSIIEVFSALFSAIVSISAVMAGWGIMSLVLQTLSAAFARSVLLIFFNKWKPILRFSWESINSVFSFSLNLLLTSLINVIFKHVYTLVIGKAYTTQDIGYYNQSKRVTDLSGNTIVETVKGVSYPIMSKQRDDITRFKSYYKNVIKLTVALVTPIMLLLILAGKEIFIILFTDKWLPAVPYLILLCLYDATLPLHLINENILKVFGDSKKILGIEIFRKILLVISIILTINISVSGLLWGQIVATIPIIFISMYLSGRLINYSVLEQFKDIIIFYVIGAVAYFISFFALSPITMSVYLSFILKLITFILIYGVLIVLLNKQLVKNFKNLINEKNRNNNISAHD